MIALTLTVTLSRVITSCAGTSMVTVRRLTLTILSTTGISTIRPGPQPAPPAGPRPPAPPPPPARPRPPRRPALAPLGAPGGRRPARGGPPPPARPAQPRRAGKAPPRGAGGTG